MAIIRHVKVSEIDASENSEISSGLKEFVRRGSLLSLNCLLHIAPIVAIESGKKYKLVAGHKSFFVARSLVEAGEKIPVLCIEASETELSNHIEAVNRLFGHLFQSGSDRPTQKEWAELTTQHAGVLGRDLSLPLVRDVILKTEPRKRTESKLSEPSVVTDQ
jgi:hypothetical protein